MSVERGVREVEVMRPRSGYVWRWKAFLRDGSGSVLCNHDHTTPTGALRCADRMFKAGGHRR